MRDDFNKFFTVPGFVIYSKFVSISPVCKLVESGKEHELYSGQHQGREAA